MTTDTNKLPAEVLADALKPFLPIMITENRDYAEVTFGDHQTQAITMAPQDWIALEAAAEALAASPGPALEAENARLREALQKIAEPMTGAWDDIAWKRREIARDALTANPVGALRTAIARAKGE